MSDTTITPEERAELRKAAKYASALPWKVEGCYSSNTNVRGIRADGVGFSVTHLSAMRDNWAEDATYIVSACNMAPRLLNALERADANVARLTKVVQILSEWCAQLESGHTLKEIGLVLSNGMACPEPWQYIVEAARQAVAQEK